MSPSTSTPCSSAISPSTPPRSKRVTGNTSSDEAKGGVLAVASEDDDHHTESTRDESSTSTASTYSPSQSSVSLDEMMVAPNNGGDDVTEESDVGQAERVIRETEGTNKASAEELTSANENGDGHVEHEDDVVRIREDANVVEDAVDGEELIRAAMDRVDGNGDTVRISNTGAASTTRAEDLFATKEAVEKDSKEDTARVSSENDGDFTGLVEGAIEGDSDGMLVVDAGINGGDGGQEEDRRVGSVVLSRRSGGAGNAMDSNPPALSDVMDESSSTNHLDDAHVVPDEVIAEDRAGPMTPPRWSAPRPSPSREGTPAGFGTPVSSLAALAGDTVEVNNSRNPDVAGDGDRDVCASPEIVSSGATCNVSPSRFSRASTAGTISTYDTAVDDSPRTARTSVSVSENQMVMMSPVSVGTAEHRMMSPGNVSSVGSTTRTPSPPPTGTGSPFPERENVGGTNSVGVIGMGGSASPPATYHNSISHLPTPIPEPDGGGGGSGGPGHGTMDADQIAARFHGGGLPPQHPQQHQVNHLHQLPQQNLQHQQQQLAFQIPTASAMDVLTQHLLNSIGQHQQNQQQQQQQQKALSSGYATPIASAFVQPPPPPPHPAVNGAPAFPATNAASPAPAPSSVGIPAFSRSSSGVGVAAAAGGGGGGKRSIRLRLVEEKDVGDPTRKVLSDSVFRRNFRRRNRAQSMGTFSFKRVMNSSSGAGAGAGDERAAAPAPPPETPKRTRETERGSIAVSWYEGTTTCELQEHVRNSIVRKLGNQEVDCVRLLDEDVEPGQVVEVVLTPHIPDGSRFLVKFKIPPPTPVKTIYKYGERAPDSPSAAPSPSPSNAELSNMPALSLNEEDRIGTVDGGPAAPSSSAGVGGSQRRLLPPPSMLPTVPSISEQEGGAKPCVGGGLNKRRMGDRSSSDSDNHPREKVVVVRATRSQEKKHVVFVIANYFVLFISLIVISAEIHDRAPRWLEEQMGRVNSCAVDRDTLFECVSNGDVSGLVATFLLWVTRNTATTRFFLFGFSSRQQLWTVVYEALVTAVCWGTSYMFIRRGLNPDTRTDFLSRYWKDAMYGSLAGFNAYFMKAVLKNLIPKEVLEDVLETRQLRIIDWLAKVVHPAAPPSKL